MKYFGNELSELHKELNVIIRKPDKLEEAKSLFLELHTKLHLSVASTEPNEVDCLLDDLAPCEYRMTRALQKRGAMSRESVDKERSNYFERKDHLYC